MEITCGEAPYLVSRYDTVTGDTLEIKNRIGLLDRKLRVVNENVENKKVWLEWVSNSYKSTYGFEWQGDSLLIARENLLYTFIDYYEDRFHNKPNIEEIKEIAIIISWNIWQMDGLKGVIPFSCKKEEIKVKTMVDFLYESNGIQNEKKKVIKECVGCKNKKGNILETIKQHNGIYCKIMDWDENKTIKFVDMIKENEK